MDEGKEMTGEGEGGEEEAGGLARRRAVEHQEDGAGAQQPFPLIAGTQLWFAARDGDTATVKTLLLSPGAESFINYQHEHVGTDLHFEVGCELVGTPPTHTHTHTHTHTNTHTHTHTHTHALHTYMCVSL